MRDLICQRLAGSQPQHPDVVQRPGWGDIPKEFSALRPKKLMPSAVLLPLVDRDGQLQVLLTQRAKHLKHHGGQICFPGGSVEKNDTGPMFTALRETQEEVGLPADSIEVVGYLDNYFTITGFSVTPVVGFFDANRSLLLDRAEVDEAFEVPLAHLFDPVNHHKKTKQMYGHDISYYEIPWQERLIWGATAAMIICFYNTIIGTHK